MNKKDLINRKNHLKSLLAYRKKNNINSNSFTNTDILKEIKIINKRIKNE
jgi:hypothetical protein